MTCTKEEGRQEEDGGEEEKGKTVIVGMKLDADSRELLTWALVKVANAGDRVIALHVIPADVPDSGWNPSFLISLIKDFESTLAVYEGFCNLKRIDLKMKICRGSSTRKTLVQEAISVAASKLVVGVAKNCNAIGSSSVSLAKYCSKKLYRCCLVVAVNNGKIIYGKDDAVTGKRFKPQLLEKSNSMREHSLNRQTEMNVDTATTTACLSIPSQSNESGYEKDESSVDKAIFKLSCSPETESRDQISSESEKETSMDADQLNEQDIPLGSASTSATREPSERRLGWLLLRKEVLNHKKKLPRSTSKSSVVKWVMRLPSLYYTASVIYVDHKPSKSGFNDEEKELSTEGEGPITSVSPASEDEGDGKEKTLPKELLTLLEKYSSVCRLFSYKEVVQATSNFSSANIIGKGGSCKVYKGCLPDGKELAFKTLTCSEKLLVGFISEIEIITKLNHRNIISLYGFCFENSHLVFVYDLLSRGNLDENLHGSKRKKSDLGWADRYKIAVGVAEALSYLHGDSNREAVIHRDIKSSNILLSDDFEPKLSDLGLAQWASSSMQNNESTYRNTDLAGTFGYLAPEYFMHGEVHEKIDIYAFGVVLLELLSGRRPVCTSCPKGEESLVMWAKPILLAENFDKVVDPLLGCNYNIEETERMCLAASLCIQQASRSRPSAALALKLLKGEDEAMDWARSEMTASMACEESNSGSAVALPSDIQSHINLALFGLDEELEEEEISRCSIDLQSDNSIALNTSLEDYFETRGRSSSSF